MARERPSLAFLLLLLVAFARISEAVQSNPCNTSGKKLKCYECGPPSPTPCPIGTGGLLYKRGDVVECDERAICSSTYDMKKGLVVHRGCSFCKNSIGCEVVHPGYLTCHCSSQDLCNGFAFNDYNAAPKIGAHLAAKLLVTLVALVPTFLI